MFLWALLFLAVAIVTGVLGFTAIATAASGIAQILFYVFVTFFVLALFLGFFGRPERRWSR